MRFYPDNIPDQCQSCIVRCGTIQEGIHEGDAYCPYHKGSCSAWFEAHDDCDGFKTLGSKASETPAYKPTDASLDRFMEGME